MPQLRIIHTITQTRRMRHLRKEPIMASMYEIEKQIAAINALVKQLCDMVGVEIPPETPDAG